MITCAICRQKIQHPLIKWKDFPITDIYMGEKGKRCVIDQEFYLCKNCGHAQLGNHINQNILYGSRYAFRTSEGGSKQSNLILKNSIPDVHFDNIIEIGCNDLYLLKQLKSKADKLIGIDPVLEESSDGKLIAKKEFAENIDFSKFRGKSLILANHFLEHIENPRKLMEILFQNLNDKSIFHFAFPCFDYLVNDGRFDQVYNHHLHYFSEYSFDYLLTEIGFKKFNQSFIPKYWGTMITTFKKDNNSPVMNSMMRPNNYFVNFAYQQFKRKMHKTILAIQKLVEPLYGYGASLQIPVLNYHLDNKLSGLEYILDDDPHKNDLYPLNLDVRIKSSSDFVLKNKNFIITAINFGDTIRSKLELGHSKNIIFPFD